MSPRRPLFIRALRAFLLVAFLGLVAGVVLLLVRGRRSAPTPAEIAERLAADAPGAEEYAVRGQVFRRAVVHDDRPVFVIEGARHRADPDGRAFFEEVTLRLEREEGSYLITGDRASYDPETNDAKVEGNVVVHGPRELRLWCEWLELSDHARRLVASRGSRFAIEGRAVGSAARLQADLERGHIQLSGGVEMETVPGIEPRSFLQAEKVTLVEDQHLIRALGDVLVGRGDDRLRARRLTLFLDDSNRNVEHLRALWEVRALLHSAALRGGTAVAAKGRAGGEPSPPAGEASGESSDGGVKEGAEDEVMRIAGQRLVLALDPVSRDPLWALINGMKTYPAILATELGGVRSREMAAVVIRGGFEGGVLTSAEAEGSVRVEERAPDGEGTSLRRLSAGSAVARFDYLGQMTALHLEHEVEIDDGEMRAVGDVADLGFITHRFDLLGAPLCEVFNSEGRITAPEVSFNDESGLLHAVGGVRTVLVAGAAGALGATPLGANDGPIHVESSEALMRRGSDEFLFRGSVRAWQGRNVLVADQLRGDREEGKRRLAASGSVKTIWHSSAAEGGAEIPPESQPIEIEAELLTYVEGEREGGLRYQRDVSALQAGRLMNCGELVVDLDDASQAEVMHCLEGSRLSDPATGRILRGERTIYYVARQEVEVFGDPLVVESPKLGRVEGRYLRYGLEDGVLNLERPPSPETP